jgi:nucleoside-diphosphate-sugar epimerase
MPQKNVALVIGATGIVGGSMIRHLDSSADWEVIGLSRRRPYYPTRAAHIAVDLENPADCAEKLGGLDRVTHVFFAGYADRPGWAAQDRPNLALLANPLDVVETIAPGLRHVCLLQGTKAYGSHLGPFRTPARERDARHMPPNFYYSQQDYLIRKSEGKPWTWSCARPHAVCGYAVGIPMNLLSCIAVYATISKELGLPLRFPGSPVTYRAMYMATEAGLLARAMEWMATTPECANEAFNVTNGDFVRFEHMWPRFSEFFDMPSGPVQRIDLPVMMADKGEIWDAVVRRHDLVPNAFADMAHWPFAQYIFTNEWDMMSDTTKCRQFGFHEYVDTEQMFIDQFAALRANRVIP